MKGDYDAVGAGLEIVADLGEKTALHQLIGGSLQIGTGDLGARHEFADGDDVGFGKRFHAVGVNFNESCGGRGGCLGAAGKLEEETEWEEREEAAERALHGFSLAESVWSVPENTATRR